MALHGKGSNGRYQIPPSNRVEAVTVGLTIFFYQAAHRLAKQQAL